MSYADSIGKNIVICCDGTGNVIGPDHTNVVKLVRSIKKDLGGQCVFYDPGVGTSGSQNALTRISKTITKVMGLAIGSGIHQNIKEAYQYLMNHYEEGDKVFLFGFSRGAYTVCALAGVLNRCGLLEKGNDNLVDLALSMYQNSWKSEEEAVSTKLFKATFGSTCKPHFLGIWDTVASVGWLSNSNPFPSASRNPDVAHVRHAISIDERRIKFPVELWQTPAGAEDQDVKEVWFAGVHSDVGGGYTEEESGLSKIALEWMLHEAQQLGLKIDEHKCLETLGVKEQIEKENMSRSIEHDSFLALPEEYNETVQPPDPKGILHNSLNGFWVLLDRLIASVTSKKYGDYRPIPDNAKIHVSALMRWKEFNTEKAKVKYAPENLVPFINQLDDGWEEKVQDSYAYYYGESYSELPDWVIQREMVHYKIESF